MGSKKRVSKRQEREYRFDWEVTEEYVGECYDTERDYFCGQVLPEDGRYRAHYYNEDGYTELDRLYRTESEARGAVMTKAEQAHYPVEEELQAIAEITGGSYEEVEQLYHERMSAADMSTGDF